MTQGSKLFPHFITQHTGREALPLCERNTQRLRDMTLRDMRLQSARCFFSANVFCSTEVGRM